MSRLRIAYLVLTLAGLLLPLGCFLAIPAQGGLIHGWFIRLYGTGPAGAEAISIAALSIWAMAETLVRRNWIALLAIPAGLLFGLSCGLPLYLLIRSARIR